MKTLYTLIITLSTSLILLGQTGTLESELSNGDIYKLAITESGIHKIDQAFLNTIGISTDNLDPRKIKILGNGSGILPEANAATRIDDLADNAIYVQGEADGSFDSGDFILFYGVGPDRWDFDPVSRTFDMTKNIYSDTAFYFLKISNENGRRIEDRANLSVTAFSDNTFDDYGRLELENVNLLDFEPSTQGTGQDWYGDFFSTTRERSYGDIQFNNRITTEQVHLKVRFAGRLTGGSANSSNVLASINGGDIFSKRIQGVNTGDSESTYARVAIISEKIIVPNRELSVSIEYPRTSSGIHDGWLDYYQINAKRELIMDGPSMEFTNIESADYNTTTLTVDNVTGNFGIWDITNPTEAINQVYDAQGVKATFGFESTELRRFVGVNLSGTHPSPVFTKKIKNQNIHGIQAADLVIIYHPLFREAASRLAEHRRTHSNMLVEMVNIEDLYNEFSSGALDATAIRDFARMLQKRSDQFNYLLLFGDGSFDYKNYLNIEGQQFIPTFETHESLHPIDGFPTDDYFALLGDTEGDDLVGAIDIAIGRIPCKTALEANNYVQKVISYDTNPETFGDWKLKMTMVGDDGDGNLHTRQADILGEALNTGNPEYNMNKIYCDAFPEISTPGGNFFPDVNESINQSMFKGQLMINYIGHGGPKGWAQERILTFTDINQWNNYFELPLFITATCSFTGFDDPRDLTAGERILLKEDGGAIALFSTVRAVFSSSNERLVRATFNRLFTEVDGEIPPIGEIMRMAKNASNQDTSRENARKYLVFGDPSMHLTLPSLNINASRINGSAISMSNMDTIRAGEEVTIEGEISDHNGVLVSDFNGTIYPTIFDKRIRTKTLGQGDDNTPLEFWERKNIIYKGVASVVAGKFSFTFIVPEDINYQIGQGKISFYADDGSSRDAAGYYDQLFIGESGENINQNDEGPLVEVFMDDESFVSGGITSNAPILLVKLSDDQGINVTGNSIGHDLIAVLDEDSQNTFVLNEFYTAELNDFTRGTAVFPLEGIAPGLHTIRVKAWDTANNSGEGSVEFRVLEDGEIIIEGTNAFPNPFSDQTNISFEHNVSAQSMDVIVYIYAADGKLVKTIADNVVTTGHMVNDIVWTGDNNVGAQLANGIYFYKIIISTTSEGNTALKAESELGKLLLLR